MKATPSAIPGLKNLFPQWLVMLGFWGTCAGAQALPVSKEAKGLSEPPSEFSTPRLDERDLQLSPAILKDLQTALNRYQAGEYVPALTVAQAAATAAPKSSIAFELVGACQLRLGQFDEGIASLLTATQLAPEKIGPLGALGGAYLAHGNLPQARKYFQQILDKKGGQPVGHEGLGLVFEREGKLDEAASHFEAGLGSGTQTGYGVNVNLARIYNLQRKFDKTLSLLGELVKASPTNESAIEMVAIAYMGTGKPDEAIQSYQLAYASKPSAPIAVGLGVSYRQNKQIPESLKYLKEAASLKADWDVPWIQLSETQIAASDFSGALASLEKAKSMATAPAAINSRIGNVHVLLKDYPKAIASFEQQAAAKEADPALRDQLGTAYQLKGDSAAAERTFKDTAKRFPKDALAPYRLGLLYDQLKRYPEAIAELEKAAVLDARNLSVQRALSITCNKAGEKRRAIEIAGKLVAEQPETVELKVFLASLHAQAGDEAKAKSIYREVLKTKPNEVVALNNLAMALARSGEFEEALGLARQAVKLIPESGQLLDSLGWITFLKGDFAQAAELLQKSAKLSAKDPSIQYHLGMARWKQNQKAAALEVFNHAVALSKDFPEYKETLGMIQSAGKELK